MHIAAAGLTDLPALARLMAASPLLERYHVTYDAALRALSAGSSDGDLLLIAHNSDSVGFAWLSFASRVLNGAAYLRLLLVAAPGHGTGAHLLAAAEDAARERANHLYLLTTRDNTSARRFYERHAYRHVGDLPGLVQPDLDEALYHKALRPFAERLSV
jgi:GNAT superfamily N-acetyltransferase